MFRAMISPTTSIAGGKPCDSRRRAAEKCLFYAAQRSERMARVPYVARDELDAEGQEIYDRIRRDRNAPEVGLQFRALLHSPKAAGYLTSLGAQLRFQSAMREDWKELAIILVAREWNSAIEWTGHAVLAARAGVSAESIEAIRMGKAPTGLTRRGPSTRWRC